MSEGLYPDWSPCPAPSHPSGAGWSIGYLPFSIFLDTETHQRRIEAGVGIQGEHREWSSTMTPKWLPKIQPHTTSRSVEPPTALVKHQSSALNPTISFPVFSLSSYCYWVWALLSLNLKLPLHVVMCCWESSDSAFWQIRVVHIGFSWMQNTATAWGKPAWESVLCYVLQKTKRLPWLWVLSVCYSTCKRSHVV